MKKRHYVTVDAEVDATDEIETAAQEIALEKIREMRASGAITVEDDMLLVKVNKAHNFTQVIRALLAHVGNDHVSRAVEKRMREIAIV